MRPASASQARSRPSSAAAGGVAASPSQCVKRLGRGGGETPGQITSRTPMRRQAAACACAQSGGSVREPRAPSTASPVVVPALSRPGAAGASSAAQNPRLEPRGRMSSAASIGRAEAPPPVVFTRLWPAWACASIRPGSTIMPEASIRCAPSGAATPPMTAIRPPCTSTSARSSTRRRATIVTTRPPVIKTRSCMCILVRRAPQTIGCRADSRKNRPLRRTVFAPPRSPPAAAFSAAIAGCVVLPLPQEPSPMAPGRARAAASSSAPLRCGRAAPTHSTSIAMPMGTKSAPGHKAALPAARGGRSAGRSSRSSACSHQAGRARPPRPRQTRPRRHGSRPPRAGPGGCSCTRPPCGPPHRHCRRARRARPDGSAGLAARIARRPARQARRPGLRGLPAWHHLPCPQSGPFEAATPDAPAGPRKIPCHAHRVSPFEEANRLFHSRFRPGAANLPAGPRAPVVAVTQPGARHAAIRPRRSGHPAGSAALWRVERRRRSMVRGRQSPPGTAASPRAIAASSAGRHPCGWFRR